MVKKIGKNEDSDTECLLVADGHVGSRNSVCLDEYCHPTPEQRYINSKWKDMAEYEKHISYLILNGDMIDGLQPANSGKELWETDIDRQAEVAAELIKMIDYDKALMTFGTPYHAGDNPSFDKLVADN